MPHGSGRNGAPRKCQIASLPRGRGVYAYGAGRSVPGNLKRSRFRLPK